MNVIFIKLCRFLTFTLELMHRGSSLPGLLALKFNKNILKVLSDKYRVILVTGTNGKTTTTSLISRILVDGGYSVISNTTGANMLSGIITLFIKHENDFKKEFAVIEIDEANVPLYSSIGSAEYIVCTNIFKDQLDRFGEIYTTMSKIKKGIDGLRGIKLVVAGDEPLFNFTYENKVYYGFETAPINNEEDKSNIEGLYCPKCNSKYIYEFYTYNHLGKYKCENCGYSRPMLKYGVSKILKMKDNYIEFLIDDNVLIKSNLSGLFSIYNIMSAYALTRELGVNIQIITKSIEDYKPQFGRHETIKFFNKEIKLILVKNPVGFNESLKLSELNSNKKYSCFILSDNFADGKDVSWIWDVDFENIILNNEEIFVSGLRCDDMAIRLVMAGYDGNKILIERNFHFLIEKLKTCSENSCIYIYATYTAMIEFRKYLAKEKIVRHSW